MYSHVKYVAEGLYAVFGWLSSLHCNDSDSVYINISPLNTQYKLAYGHECILYALC